MLRKIRKFLTFDASVLVYKQMILPIIDYSGFMITACRKDEIGNLQTFQNDILRICNMSRISDKVSIEKLHEKCKLISLEQRRRKQFLRLMYLLSSDVNFLHVPGRLTRNANRITFKVPTGISNIYEHSPYYIGTVPWNALHQAIQESNSIFEFKREIDRMNKTYVKM